MAVTVPDQRVSDEPLIFIFRRLTEEPLSADVLHVHDTASQQYLLLILLSDLRVARLLLGPLERSPWRTFTFTG